MCKWCSVVAQKITPEIGVLTPDSPALYSYGCKDNYREEVKLVDKVDLALAIAALSAILQAITVWQNRDRE
ncbi:membrane protein [Gordonia phage Phabuloso]|nr:membrane protein [Gordonia phage Phabuloso]